MNQKRDVLKIPVITFSPDLSQTLNPPEGLGDR